MASYADWNEAFWRHFFEPESCGHVYLALDDDVIEELWQTTSALSGRATAGAVGAVDDLCRAVCEDVQAPRLAAGASCRLPGTLLSVRARALAGRASREAGRTGVLGTRAPPARSLGHGCEGPPRSIWSRSTDVSGIVGSNSR